MQSDNESEPEASLSLSATSFRGLSKLEGTMVSGAASVWSPVSGTTGAGASSEESLMLFGRPCPWVTFILNCWPFWHCSPS